jgi:uncharacterized membrane protein YbhN (UPF0104 family)
VRRPTRGITGIVLGVVISAVALLLAVRWSGWAPLLVVLRQVDYLVLIPAVAIYLISMTARALAWRVILGGRASLLRMLAALNQGYLMNNLLPWRMGELGRAILLGRRPGLSTGMVLSSIVVERLYDMSLAVALLLALGPVAFGASWAPRAALVGGIAVMLALGVLWLVLARPQVIVWLLRRLPGGLGRWQGLWDNLLAGLASLRDVRQLLAGYGWMVLSWALAAGEYWLVLRAFVPQAQGTWALLALCVTLLGVAIPSAPGYIGVFEASAVAALAVFHVDSSLALGYALVLHGLHFGTTTLLGAVALAGEGETLTGAVRAIRSWTGGTTEEAEAK